MKKEVKYGDVFDVDINEPVYTSGVIHRLLGIPVWVLKQLDKENIVRPPRKKGKSRLYSKGELDRLSHIWYLMKEKKVKVDGLKVILEIEKKIFKKD
ncbi:MAG: MerR family transcriptional regulator [Candidatus Omnitrophica bacterium]|nr:MerR family transcriptional regulator [Candidatus Omnitrophota bacterium]